MTIPKISFKYLAPFVAAALLIAPAANAAFITYTSESAWDTAVGASVTEDFNSITTETSFRTSPVTVGNMTFSGFTPSHPDFNEIGTTDPFFGFTSTNVRIATSSVAGDQARIDFVTGVSAWGADIANLEPVRASSFTVFDAGDNALGTFNSYTAGTGFHGFELTAGEVASYLVFNSATVDEFFGLDDAKFVTSEAAVSEPGSLAIFGLSFIGLGYMRRRKAA